MQLYIHHLPQRKNAACKQGRYQDIAQDDAGQAFFRREHKRAGQVHAARHQADDYGRAGVQIELLRVGRAAQRRRNPSHRKPQRHTQRAQEQIEHIFFRNHRAPGQRQHGRKAVPLGAAVALDGHRPLKAHRGARHDDQHPRRGQKRKPRPHRDKGEQQNHHPVPDEIIVLEQQALHGFSPLMCMSMISSMVAGSISASGYFLCAASRS